ncbi:DNA gyrase inhibitor YacG [Maritalea sp.]|uniref:DNA gyrase inhibitor YacG n=1 Tax=Maritalea sp. TaxID=2003361 RepID=UPI003EF0DC5A
MNEKTAPSNSPAKSSKPCVMCEKPAVEKYLPFCSKRCADLDLGKWLNGSYAIPVIEEDGGQLDDSDPE